MREAAVLHRVMLALSSAGFTVFRNNVGVARTESGDVIRFGVCNPGGADLIGWTPQGRFLAVECKSKGGRVSPAQQQFLDAVNRSGGIGIVTRDPDTVVADVMRFSNQ